MQTTSAGRQIPPVPYRLEDDPVQPFGTLKIARRTFPLLIVSIKVPTKTRAPSTATSR